MTSKCRSRMSRLRKRRKRHAEHCRRAYELRGKLDAIWEVLAGQMTEIQPWQKEILDRLRSIDGPITMVWPRARLGKVFYGIDFAAKSGFTTIVRCVKRPDGVIEFGTPEQI